MITFSCPSCGKSLRAPESAAGRKGPCKKCGATVRVPDAEPELPPEEQPSRSPSDRLSAASDKLKELRENPLIARLTNDNQDPAVVARITEKVKPILMTGEELRYIAVQQRPIANFAPDAVVLTNKRFMIFRTKILGRLDFDDFVWRNLHDCRLKESVLGATISIVTASGDKLSIGYLPKKQAREVYRYAQEMEESALNEQRQRQLEDARAAAGGVVIQGERSSSNGINQSDPLARLQQLKSMVDAGLISSDEFERKKAQILSDM